MSNRSLASNNNGEDKNSGNSISSESNNKEVIEEALPIEPHLEPTKEESGITENGGIYLGYKSDSTNLNSVNKFNFIFYFIYKLKYDEDPNTIGQINYEF